MLGYCGIHCDACPAYQGTITTNLELLEKAAGEYSDGAHPAKEWVCLGCTPAGQPFLATYCAQCKIRTCASDKGIPNCAACDAFDSCPTMREFMHSERDELARRMGWLRERFLVAPRKP
jgi:hypothetical protein